MRRVVLIFAKFTNATGHKHPQMQTMLENYRALLKKSGQTEEESMQRVRSAMQEGGLSPGG